VILMMGEIIEPTSVVTTRPVSPTSSSDSGSAPNGVSENVLTENTRQYLIILII
jgi:hypothetical protein